MQQLLNKIKIDDEKKLPQKQNTSITIQELENPISSSGQSSYVKKKKSVAVSIAQN
jgi:hypothetical protein